VPGAALGVDEQPADMRVKQARDRSAPAASVADVRAVRVPLDVGERVVLTMVSHPRDHRPFNRGRAEHGKHGPHRSRRRERSVRQVAVEADRDAQAGRQIEDRKHDKIAAVQPVAPHLPRHEPQPCDRRRGHDSRDQAVARLIRRRLDIIRDRGSGCQRHRRPDTTSPPPRHRHPPKQLTTPVDV
jgi:hypothetical protein